MASRVLRGRVTKSRIHSSVLAPRTHTLDDPIAATSSPTSETHGQPPAWADYRPELSDTLPWFRAVQGGAYHNGNLCWGFLLDADCGIRSYIDDEIVITRIGGGCTKDAAGNLVPLKDQDSDNSIVNSVIKSKELKVPVGLIIGNRNTLLGRKLPHRYNVMAYFRITDVWFEKIGQRVGGKVRFEKLDLSTKSWWAAKGSPSPIAHQERRFKAPEKKFCRDCGLESPRIYNEVWMCLETSCKSFWTIDRSVPSADLTFHQQFLEYRAPYDPAMQPHHSLIPDLLSTIDEDDPSLSALRIAWKGIVCPRCQKCISRRFWRGWKCTDDLRGREVHQGEPCSFEKFLEMRPISLRSVLEDLELSPIKRILHFDPKFAIPEVDDTSLYPYRKLTYRIPGVGHIVHFVSNKAINSRLNGPDDLFGQMQATDLGLRRYPLLQSVVAGTLTCHFAVNYGMPYKYVVSVDSKGFDEAPDVVLRALGRLAWATENAVKESGDPFLSPNELLILGYLEDMKIGYHDDGESSLGPTIATLSLGARSTMLVRMKHKYYHGFSKAKKLLGVDPVLPGCHMQRERKELRDRLHNGKISPAEYDEFRWSTFKKARNAEAPPIIKMELNHGDLVVMHGEGLQKYYEHSVIPEKKLRFALTARYIKPEHVDRKELKKGGFSLSADQIYNGR